MRPPTRAIPYTGTRATTACSRSIPSASTPSTRASPRATGPSTPASLSISAGEPSSTPVTPPQPTSPLCTINGSRTSGKRMFFFRSNHETPAYLPSSPDRFRLRREATLHQFGHLRTPQRRRSRDQPRRQICPLHRQLGRQDERRVLQQHLDRRRRRQGPAAHHPRQLQGRLAALVT